MAERGIGRSRVVTVVDGPAADVSTSPFGSITSDRAVGLTNDSMVSIATTLSDEPSDSVENEKGSVVPIQSYMPSPWRDEAGGSEYSTDIEVMYCGSAFTPARFVSEREVAVVKRAYDDMHGMQLQQLHPFVSKYANVLMEEMEWLLEVIGYTSRQSRVTVPQLLAILGILRHRHEASYGEEEVDVVEAFACAGGNGDRGGTVAASRMRRICDAYKLDVDVDAMFAEVDVDKSGFVDYDEFREIFTDSGSFSSGACGPLRNGAGDDDDDEWSALMSMDEFSGFGGSMLKSQDTFDGDELNASLMRHTSAAFFSRRRSRLNIKRSSSEREAGHTPGRRSSALLAVLDKIHLGPDYHRTLPQQPLTEQPEWVQMMRREDDRRRRLFPSVLQQELQKKAPKGTRPPADMSAATKRMWNHYQQPVADDGSVSDTSETPPVSPTGPQHFKPTAAKADDTTWASLKRTASAQGCSLGNEIREVASRYQVDDRDPQVKLRELRSRMEVLDERRRQDELRNKKKAKMAKAREIERAIKAPGGVKVASPIQLRPESGEKSANYGYRPVIEVDIDENALRAATERYNRRKETKLQRKLTRTSSKMTLVKSGGGALHHEDQEWAAVQRKADARVEGKMEAELAARCSGKVRTQLEHAGAIYHNRLPWKKKPMARYQGEPDRSMELRDMVTSTDVVPELSASQIRWNSSTSVTKPSPKRSASSSLENSSGLSNYTLEQSISGKAAAPAVVDETSSAVIERVFNEVGNQRSSLGRSSGAYAAGVGQTAAGSGWRVVGRRTLTTDELTQYAQAIAAPVPARQPRPATATLSRRRSAAADRQSLGTSQSSALQRTKSAYTPKKASIVRPETAPLRRRAASLQ